MEKSSIEIRKVLKDLYNRQVICLFCVHYLKKTPVEGEFSVTLFLSIFFYKFSYFCLQLGQRCEFKMPIVLCMGVKLGRSR
jgi:hypothetical protein